MTDSRINKSKVLFYDILFEDCLYEIQDDCAHSVGRPHCCSNQGPVLQCVSLSLHRLTKFLNNDVAPHPSVFFHMPPSSCWISAIKAVEWSVRRTRKIACTVSVHREICPSDSRFAILSPVALAHQELFAASTLASEGVVGIDVAGCSRGADEQYEPNILGVFQV